MILMDVFEHDGKIYCWTQTPEGKNEYYWQNFQPVIFFHTFNEPYSRQVLQGQQAELTTRNDFVKKSVPVLKITFASISDFKQNMPFIEERLRNVGTFYNVDIPIPEMFIFKHQLIPFGKVQVHAEKNGQLISIHNCDDPTALDYELPNWKLLELRMEVSPWDTIDAIEANGMRYSSKELPSFVNYFLELDPDVITANQTPRIIMQLAEQCRKINPLFRLNRVGTDVNVNVKDSSYFSYGRVYHRQSPIYLKGRFMLPSYPHEGEDNEFTLISFVEGSRVCRQTLQRLASHSVGAASNNRLVCEAVSRGYLIPYKVGIYERMKPFRQLVECDRGPFTLEPIVGFHSNVIELDFASMFPSIMETYNLSPEKLGCKCCSDKVIGETGYHFCSKGKGIVPIVCGDFIRRRQAYKLRPDNLSKAKVSYLKWLLVVIFGYQAAQHKKIGTIEVHETINAIARETMVKTIHLAEEAGFEVLHAIVDSLYLKKKNYSMEEVQTLIQRINTATNLKIEFKGAYSRMVFLPSIVRAYQPVPTRYYAITKSGELKLRGIEARQSSAPPIVRQMQTEIITQMGKQPTHTPFQLMQNSIPILKQYIDSLPMALAEHLAFTICLSKTDYHVNGPQKIVLQQLNKKGRQLVAGQSIQYVIEDFSRKKYREISEYAGAFDQEKYSQVLKKGFLNLFLPLNVSIHEINDLLDGKRQTRMIEFNLEEAFLPSIRGK